MRCTITIRKNDPSDSKVLIALQDADRVVNLSLDCLMRCGQYYPDNPTVDADRFLGDSRAEYHNPRSVLKAVMFGLEWVQEGSDVCIRTRLGKQMGQSRAKLLRTLAQTMRTQIIDEGLDLPT